MRLFSTFLNSPALRNVKSGLLADLSQMPAPQPSHHARVISFPLSAFCVYVFGSGLVVSISAVFTNRWAECLDHAGPNISRMWQFRRGNRAFC